MTDMLLRDHLRVSVAASHGRFFTQRGVHEDVHARIQRGADAFEPGGMSQHQLAARVGFFGGSARDFGRHASRTTSWRGEVCRNSLVPSAPAARFCADRRARLVRVRG